VIVGAKELISGFARVWTMLAAGGWAVLGVTSAADAAIMIQSAEMRGGSAYVRGSGALPARVVSLSSGDTQSLEFCVWPVRGRR
jgi:hypothetical protein